MFGGDFQRLGGHQDSVYGAPNIILAFDFPFALTIEPIDGAAQANVEDVLRCAHGANPFAA
jgi:hypothetical protein